MYDLTVTNEVESLDYSTNNKYIIYLGWWCVPSCSAWKATKSTPREDEDSGPFNGCDESSVFSVLPEHGR